MEDRAILEDRPVAVMLYRPSMVKANTIASVMHIYMHDACTFDLAPVMMHPSQMDSTAKYIGTSVDAFIFLCQWVGWATHLPTEHAS